MQSKPAPAAKAVGTGQKKEVAKLLHQVQKLAFSAQNKYFIIKQKCRNSLSSHCFYSHREVVLKTDHFSKPLRGGYIRRKDSSILKMNACVFSFSECQFIRYLLA